MSTSPAIIPEGIYTRRQVETNLGLSPHTLGAWIEFNGLNPIQPGTRFQYFLGSELIAFMVKHRDGVVKPRSAKERAELRKGVKP